MLAVMDEAPPRVATPAREPLVAAASSPPRRTWRRTLWRWGRIPLFVYVGLVVVMASLQSRLIFPGQQTQGQPAAVVRPRPGTELVELKTRDGDRVVALFGPALSADGQPLADAASRPTMLFFYGNGMYLKAAEEEFEEFRRLGVNVMIPEYVGYGMSGGQASESGCYATADAAYEHLRNRKDIDPNKIMASGWSLGGAVAIDLASRRPVVGLMTFSAFTRMAEVVRHHYPWLPASLLLRHRFESLKKVPHVPVPILMGHGKRDDLIPFPMMARLAAAAKSPVKTFAVDGAGHNDFFLVAGPRLDEEIRGFLAILGETSR